MTDADGRFIPLTEDDQGEGIKDFADSDEVALQELKDLRKKLESEVRERFKHIIEGKGRVIPRIAIQTALDDLFPRSK